MFFISSAALASAEEDFITISNGTYFQKVWKDILSESDFGEQSVSSKLREQACLLYNSTLSEQTQTLDISRYDGNQDGYIDARDLFLFRQDWYISQPTVGSVDTPTPTPLRWDIDNNGVVDNNDLQDFHQSWHKTVPIVATPTHTASPKPTEKGDMTIQLPGDVSMEMVHIPSGSFFMGSKDPGWSYADELPVHTVNIKYDFFMCKYEVTQAQWSAVMGQNPSYYSNCGDSCPVETVSWNECQNFIIEINKLNLGIFRLPSEAEWEYACRAGTQTRFYFGDSDCLPTGCAPCQLNDYAWWCGNSVLETHPVGQKLSNAFGLYDMYGNVWEWCQDYMHNDYSGAPADGSAWEDSSGTPYRVVRGYYWYFNPVYCRSSFRFKAFPDNKRKYLGVRLVLTQ